jgi:hypothetical protein
MSLAMLTKARWLLFSQGSSSPKVFQASIWLGVLNHVGGSPNAAVCFGFFAAFEAFWISDCASGGLRFDEEHARSGHRKCLSDKQ